MTNRVQIFRTPTTGVAPAAGTRLPGELWVNFADFQLGMVDASKNAQKLVAVRYFVTTANYAVGEFVVQAGALYVANTAVTAGAFSAPQWNKISLASDITAAVPVASTTAPAMDGAAAVGVGVTWARADHVHPTDTSRAPLASPAFTGAPSMPTGTTGVTQTAGDSSTKLATTAFVGALPVAMNDNQIINGNFAVNQRTYVSGTALATTVYGHDRWKAGPSGCTYTFPATLPDTIATITAGTLTQVIEAGAIIGGVCTLSWTGTAQARVYQGTPTGAYAASPIVTASLPAGVNTIVEFNAGTVSKVKFEAGSVATPYPRQSLAKSVADCQRYYQKLGGAASAANLYFAGYGPIGSPVGFPSMRAAPTATVVGSWSLTNVASIILYPCANTVGVQVNATSSTAATTAYTTDATCFITLAAEL